MENRLAHHKSELKHNRHANSYLQNSWNKYGSENFSFLIVEQCTEDQLDERERYYIQYYQTMNREHGYNRESGGSKLKHMSEDSKKKMSEAKQGVYDGDKNPMYGVCIKWTEERRQKMSERFSGCNNPMYGKHVEFSQEWKAEHSKRMSGVNNPFYGQKHTEETKLRMRKNNRLKKQVTCIETGATYDSVQEAGRQTGVYSDSIGKCCRGTQHTAGGYHWQYAA